MKTALYICVKTCSFVFVGFKRSCYAKSLQSCPTLCDPIDGSPPGFPVLHISWSWLKLMCIEPVMPSNRLILCHALLLLPPIPPSIGVFSNESTLRIRWPKYGYPITAAAAAAKSLQSCPTLCNPIDGSPPGSSVPGILQARTLEWVAFPSPMHESEK